MSRTMFGKLHLIYRTLIGNEYHSDSAGKMTGVAEGDVRDLVSVGCVDRDIATQAVLGGINALSGDGTKSLMGDGTFQAPGGGSTPRFLPFFGDTTQLWHRPALGIGGSSSNFNLWLNRGNQAAKATDSDIVSPGTGYLVGDTWTAAGGSGASPATLCTVTDILGVSATIVNGGSGGTPGSVIMDTTTGAGVPIKFNCTIGGGGNITSINSINSAGDLTANLTDHTHEPMVDDAAGPIAGVVFNIVLGVHTVGITNPGFYATVPSSPVAQGATSGSGTGLTVNITYSTLATATDGAGGVPLAMQISSVPGMGGNPSYPTALLKPPRSAPPWTITAGLAGVLGGTDDMLFLPIILYDQGSNSAVVLAWFLRAGWARVLHYSNLTPGNAAFSEVMHSYTPLDYFEWFRITNDGTNLTFFTSSENVVYLQIHQEAAPTVTHVGFGIDRSNGLDVGDQGLAALWNWVDTSP